MAYRKADDLFFSTLEQLHGQAPVELLNTLRAQLNLIKQTNPNSAQTAEACLHGLKSDRSTLLHVLTAAYLINGGVMLKHQVTADELTETGTKELVDLEFGDLEEELDKFSLSMSGEVKPYPPPQAPLQAPLQASLQPSLQPPPQSPADPPPQAHQAQSPSQPPL